MNKPILLQRTLQSSYMRFAKQDTAARFNLAMSGIADCALSDLEIGPDDLALHGSNSYGYRPLIDRIATRFGVPADCVVTPGGGCSFSNHLAMSALVSPGDEVLVEDPTYELLTSTLECLGAQVRTFERRRSQDWRLDPQEIAGNMTPRTRLVVLTNLHNPSGAMASEADIQAIAAAAATVGAHVLVDEVYLELTFADGAARTSFAPDSNVLVTSSLTKAYGLSGLRCGWILAPAELAQRMRRLNDLFGVAPPHIAERLAVVAFDQLDRLRARARGLLEPNLAAYREILGDHPDLDQVIFPTATTVFPRLRRGDADALFEQLRSEQETSFVPGRFFGRPDHLRVALGGQPESTREGLLRLRAALDKVA
ncbi:MAG: pyridoxal phosphate-dependent aminotransferase [Caulobacteraceae bacterium]|nr:pyridoxal phosphate-dependent aminotransferase [Caulobacteraceae bacterium]